jgi:hypothetical protein
VVAEVQVVVLEPKRPAAGQRDLAASAEGPADDLTPEFSVGVGSRCWSMQIPTGTTNFFSKGEFFNQRYATEQTALFAQGSYKFNGPLD